MRYNLFGHEVQPVANYNPSTPGETQLTNYTVVYTTDDLDECKAIVRNGGFIIGETHYAVIWAEDSITHGVMGEKPMTTEAYKKTARQALRKDQV